ncbi:MAG: DUF3987 domain-containing protein [Chromatiaceae bacterium]|nr:DUF3987 domain-containing protein [Chromatiaceae bacterium]
MDSTPSPAQIRADLAAQAPRDPFEAIPGGMRDARRWLGWKAVTNGSKKPRKVPHYCDGTPRRGALDTPEDLARLATFAEACAALATGRYAGLGFALGLDPATGHHWQGIDLDGTDTRPELAALVDRLPGYVERSPSGKGWHAIGIGPDFETLGSNATGIEAYAHGRYFTVTGTDGRGDLEDLAPFIAETLRPLHSPDARQSRVSDTPFAGESFFAKVNAKAMANLSAWVPDLFPQAKPHHDGYRVASRRLGRALEEDLSFHPSGIRDFGEERGLTPIDTVLEWGAPSDATAAALWLCDRLGVDPAALGWKGRRGEQPPQPPGGERGEKGETPATARDERGANPGRIGAKKGESGANLSDDEKRAALARAARVLTADASPAAVYPIDALGPLADATRALADGVQIREAMAGQSLLAVVAMLAQSVANVRTIEAVKPLSLYCLTIGESGDGKSSGDAIAQAAVQARQRIEARSYLDQVREAQATAKGRVKGDPPPEELPPEPYRIARDGTVEGIRRSFAQGVPSQGVFSSEAAAMLAGYGMNPDNRAKTAATFNALWDDGELSVSRGTTGRLQLYDRRLSIHWLLQPEAAHEVMSDPLLSGIGFWPRFMIAWPEPSAPRVARPWRADQCPQIGDFWRACNRLLDRPLGDDCADLPALELSDEAMRLACAFFERMEQAAKGRPAPLREVKPYAVRSTEQALRVAGVLSVYAGSGEVDAEAMRNGIALAAYSLETWRGVFGDRDVRTARQLALTLYRWLLDQPEACASLTAISRIGPKATRSKDKRDTALAVLEHAGLAENMGYTWSARA